ncbi:MAG: 30S ribosomal protein S6 [Parcubacteria group bacterium RIFCSPHIGHO2_01_FULL_40_30]|nr:MAG: 30S ribosomal protein S6 [Parcubacteria group bacterium RIFCSPHIGHO2_01_FULL_40_30]
MEELSERQQYELAFHLLPSFTENQIEEKRREIEGLISKNGGIVGRYGEIKKMRLAYPIKKEQFSNFGYIEFFAPRNIIEKINKNLVLNENLLRYMVIKKEEEKIKPAKAPKIKTEKPLKEAVPTEITQKETEELDKKIEEILEKL